MGFSIVVCNDQGDLSLVCDQILEVQKPSVGACGFC